MDEQGAEKECATQDASAVQPLRFSIRVGRWYSNAVPHRRQTYRSHRSTDWTPPTIVSMKVSTLSHDWHRSDKAPDSGAAAVTRVSRTGVRDSLGTEGKSVNGPTRGVCKVSYIRDEFLTGPLSCGEDLETGCEHGRSTVCALSLPLVATSLKEFTPAGMREYVGFLTFTQDVEAHRFRSALTPL
jgi:hypothetical protein